MQKNIKVLNIVRFLPIEGFRAENDITLKIYVDLKKIFNVDSLFIMPVTHIPKWLTKIKDSLKNNFKIINNRNYFDQNSGFHIRFFQSILPLTVYQKFPVLSFYGVMFQFIFYKKKIFEIVKEYRPDIIHAHTLRDAFYAYKIYKKYKIPYIITLRGTFSKIYIHKIAKNIFKHSNFIVTPSSSLKKDLESNYSIELLPHGLDSIWYLNESKKFSETQLNIVTVARLQEWKNIQLVLKSLSKLKAVGIKFKYSIVGEGYYMESLKSLSKFYNISDDVIFYGYINTNEIREVFNQNDIYVMLSYPETFGRVFFEAAAQGLLIIGRKDTGIDGHLSNSDEAFILEPDAEVLANILKSIDETIFNKMTNKSRIKVKRFHKDLITKRYYEILNNSKENPNNQKF